MLTVTGTPGVTTGIRNTGPVVLEVTEADIAILHGREELLVLSTEITAELDGQGVITEYHGISVASSLNVAANKL